MRVRGIIPLTLIPLTLIPLTLLSALCFPFSAFPAQVNLAWSPSPSTNVTGYILYAGTNTLSGTNATPASVRANVGNNLTTSVDFLRAGRWHFHVTAHDDRGVESEPSNELAVQVPEPPAGLRTVLVEYTLDVSSTNWSTAGFLRLKIQ